MTKTRTKASTPERRLKAKKRPYVHAKRRIRVQARDGRLYAVGSMRSIRVRKALGLDDLPENLEKARAMALEIEVQIERGEWKRDVYDERMTFDQLADLYLDRPKKISRDRERLIESVRDWFGSFYLDDIRPVHVAAWLKDRYGGASFGTQRLVLAAFKAIINHGVSMELCDPIKTPHVPRGFRRTRHLSEADRDAVLEASPEWLREFLTFLFFTGARPVEALGLGWEDVDMEREVVFLTSKKGSGVGTRRRVKMNADVLKVMKANEGRLPMFVNSFGDRLQHNTAHKALKAITDRLGIEDFRLYDCRHTFASVLLAKGATLPMIQELLGHTSINMTMRYVHLTAGAADDAIDKL